MRYALPASTSTDGDADEKSPQSPSSVQIGEDGGLAETPAVNRTDSDEMADDENSFMEEATGSKIHSSDDHQWGSLAFEQEHGYVPHALEREANVKSQSLFAFCFLC